MTRFGMKDILEWYKFQTTVLTLCVSCFLLKAKKCVNILRISSGNDDIRDGDSSMERGNSNAIFPPGNATTEGHTPLSPAPRYNVSVLNKSDTNVCDLSVSDHDINFDAFMHKA